MRRPGSPVDDTPRPRSFSAGFSMIELMWAIFILAIVMGAVAVGLSSTLNLSRNNSNRSVAANLASEKIDEMRQLAAKSFTSLPISYSSVAVPVDGVPFTVATDADWIPKGAETNPCDSESDNPIAYVRVTVNVSWENMGGVTPVTSSTIITPPIKTFSSGKGNVGVKVIGAQNQPQEDLTVTLTAPGGTPTYTKKTSSAGCAFFAYVDPLTSGAYTATLNEPGYVDPDGNQLVTKAATVLAGETADPLGFKYDQAASLDLTLKGVPVGGAPIMIPTTSLPVTVGNSELFSGTRTFAAPPTASATRTISGLFPFKDSLYSIWAGDCVDSDPEGKQPDGSLYYLGGLRDPGVILTAGGSASLDVQMQSIEFTVYRLAALPGNEQANKVIVADHDAAVGECPAPGPLVLGTTDSTGKLRVAIPYGHFTFSVQGETPMTTWLDVISSPPADAVAPVELVIQ